MSLKVHVSKDGDHALMVFEGDLDENAELPELNGAIAGELRLDLEKLGMINSLGARKWIQWIRRRTDAKGGIVLLRCKPGFVHQMNILAGFLPPHARVDSFYAPYYCDSCGHEEAVLFKRAVDFDEHGRADFPEERACPVCQSAMALDVVPSRYFRFVSQKSA